MSSIKNQVEHLMSLDQKFRDDDYSLTLAIWKEYGLELTPAQKLLFCGAPSMDSIIRRRRELSHKYPASPPVLAKRFKNYVELKDEFSTKRSLLSRLIKRKVDNE